MNLKQQLENLKLAHEAEGLKIKQLEDSIKNDNWYILTDLNSIEDASKILKFTSYKELTIAEELELIIKAANYIDNDYKEWKVDFKNSTQSKWIPYFERKNSGWVLFCLYDYCYGSNAPVWSYFKNKSTGEYIVKKFINKYNNYLG